MERQIVRSKIATAWPTSFNHRWNLFEGVNQIIVLSYLPLNIQKQIGPKSRLRKLSLRGNPCLPAGREAMPPFSVRLPRTFQVLAMTEWAKGFAPEIGIWIRSRRITGFNDLEKVAQFIQISTASLTLRDVLLKRDKFFPS
jgi:hypothetical protein